ncbi:hypothetical protein QUB28_28040 [Microcoleus sp. B4-C3]|uniref:hypothetical protein n=1 Tax=Microcoleus sp. B4-C2 TaxID=2818661 RepID=UPI002FD659B1
MTVCASRSKINLEAVTFQLFSITCNQFRASIDPECDRTRNYKIPQQVERG